MDILYEISKGISNQRNMSLEKMFAMFGFTKDYLVSHADEFLIIEQDNVKRYFHKDKALFDEVIKIENFKFITEYILLTL